MTSSEANLELVLEKWACPALDVALGPGWVRRLTLWHANIFRRESLSQRHAAKSTDDENRIAT